MAPLFTVAAAGFADGLGRGTTLVVGDLSFLHDINGLNLLRSGEARQAWAAPAGPRGRAQGRPCAPAPSPPTQRWHGPGYT